MLVLGEGASHILVEPCNRRLLKSKGLAYNNDNNNNNKHQLLEPNLTTFIVNDNAMAILCV